MKHTEVWNIWSAIVPLATLIHLKLTNTPPAHYTIELQLMHTGVYAACIACQSSSLAYHTLNPISPRVARALYNLDLAGVCCMSLGSPWLFVTAYGTEGLEAYITALFTLTIWCVFLLARAIRTDTEASCERYIIALAALGNYPALAHPATTAAAATILTGYVAFYRLRFPECVFPAASGTPVSSHVLWHYAVFAGQLGYVSSTFKNHSASKFQHKTADD